MGAELQTWLPHESSLFSVPLVSKVSNSFTPAVYHNFANVNLGSSVVQALLKDGTFLLRAICRNPESEAGLKLSERGVEVARGDTGDRNSLVNAMRGCEAVFAVRGAVGDHAGS